MTSLKTDNDLVSALAAIPGGLDRAYAVPEQRVLYVSINKNACTSLKWAMADIAGENLAAFTAGMMPFTGDEESVHNRRLWKASPTLNRLSPDLVAQIHPDNGWFVFAVIRDPRVRLFAAWQNKLLLENPACTHWRKEAWYPGHPGDQASIVADFARFVDHLERNPTHRMRTIDAHFRNQVDLLALDAITYSHIYDIGELGTLRNDLQTHLDSVGWQGEVRFRRFNATPLKANAAVFSGGVREKIEAMYAPDFARFGDRWDYAPVATAPEWSRAQFAEVDTIAELCRRIGDVRNMALRFQVQAEAQQRKVEARRKRLRRLRRMTPKQFAGAVARRLPGRKA